MVGSAENFVGEAAALLAAFLWAAATLLFGRLGRSLQPLVLNVVKGVIAIALLLLTLLAQSLLQTSVESATSESATSLPLLSVVYLLLSGAVGIGLGDTAYFAAINALGARRALLLETLAPPIAAILAWIFLAERLSFYSVVGIVITLSGIAWVISERVPGVSKHKSHQPITRAGLKIAVLATFCQASGAVLSRAALAGTVVSPLWSSLIRLLAGLVCMLVWAWFQFRAAPQRVSPLPAFVLNSVQSNSVQSTVPPKSTKDISSDEPSDNPFAKTTNSQTLDSPFQSDLFKNLARLSQKLKSPRLLLAIGIAAFFGTYLGIWLQQISLKYTAAGIAQALLATSPLFVLPMAAALGERLSWRSVLGALVALSGVWLLLFSGQ